MSDGGGFFCPRFFRDDVERGLFKGWRESAWVELTRVADYKTGVVRLTVREMALRWDTSVGSVDRWLGELESTGRYLRSDRLGATAREGRCIIVLDIEERNQKSGSDWNKDWNKDGTMVGTKNGTNKPSNGAAKSGVSGTKVGTMVGTKAEQCLEHVQRIVPNEEVLTIPTVSCDGGAGDLFGERDSAQPPSPSEPEPDKASVVARRVVAVFHDLSKARGGNGISAAMWGAQQKIAESALKTILHEQEATDALRWGMGEEFWRQRLRGHQMKVLVDVWSAWVEDTGGANGRNGNGRNGTGGAGGEAGAGAQAGSATGRTAVAIVRNGRWERQ